MIASAVVLAVLFVAVTRGLPLLAWIAGEEYIAHNAQWEGARILGHRWDVSAGRFGAGADILLAGSSRIMADCSAAIIAEKLEAYGGGSGLIGQNLGNVGSNFSAFAARLQNGRMPRLLILEFSPHMLGQRFVQGPPDDSAAGTLEAYRKRVTLAEMYISGITRRLIGAEGMVRVRPVDLPALWQFFSVFRRDQIPLAQLYYFLRAAEGYAQHLRPDGQVYYYSYLTGRPAAEQARLIISTRSGFNHTLLKEPVRREQMEGLKALIDAVHQGNGDVVVWRPPVDPWLYQTENQHKAAGIATTLELLAAAGTPYLDMNPHPYSTSDLSHVDWFDTPRLSRDLAAQIAAALKAKRAKEKR